MNCCSERCICEMFSYLPKLGVYPNCSDITELEKFAPNKYLEEKLKEKITKIKALLEEIENDTLNKDDTILADFSFLELPEIVSNIIDFLQPLINPYQSAIYWHLFNNSIIKTGNNLIRVSTRGLGAPKTVVLSASGQSEGLSYKAVQKALAGLEDFGAIRKAGDTNREGTLYKVFLPEEIEACKNYMKEKSIENPIPVDDKKEQDYYNIKENRYKVFERDGYICHYCGKQLTRFSATLDHIQPVSKGGDNSYDNLITACLHCNSQRTNKDVMNAIIKGGSKRTTSNSE